MEKPRPKIAVLRHSDSDGFGAAYAVWKALKDTCELLFIPVQYSQDPPLNQLREFGPDKVFIVDFSYKAEELRALNAEFPDLTVFDHHKTALPELQAWLPTESVNPGKGSYFFDESLSGCGLVWNMFHLDPEWDVEIHEFQPSLPMPEILLYVQDRDLWRFELEHSKEINAYIATLPEDFEVWDDFYLPEAYTAGRAVLAFQDAQVTRRLRDVRMIGFNPEAKMFGFYPPLYSAVLKEYVPQTVEVPFVNASENQSELGEAMCKAFPTSPFSVSYCDRPDGKRSYSLRSSRGFDVSAVCKAFGGGGHHKEGKGGAGGFTLPSPDII